jgi:hypothetical protein
MFSTFINVAIYRFLLLNYWNLGELLYFLSLFSVLDNTRHEKRRSRAAPELSTATISIDVTWTSKRRAITPRKT